MTNGTCDSIYRRGAGADGACREPEAGRPDRQRTCKPHGRQEPQGLGQAEADEVCESWVDEMIHDMAGKKFGKITVVDFAFKGKDGRDKWNCCCDCGKELVIDGKNLRTGNTKSCGCVRLEKAIARILTLTKTHGLKKTRLYRLWSGMKARCNNPNTVSYRLYGGRGIKVCNEWN